MNDPEIEEIFKKLNTFKINFSKEDQNLDDKDYLEIFKNIDIEIEDQRSQRLKIDDSDMSEIINFINSCDDMKKVDIRTSKNLDDRIEKTHDTGIKNSKFISKGSTGVFSSLKNAVRQSSANRFETFSNTEARLIKDDLVAPLKLTQYTTKQN
jgi:hypothetical protein